MHPQTDGGAESSGSFKHSFCYKNKEITAKVGEKMQKNLITDNQDHSSLKTNSALSFKTAENSALLTVLDFFGLFRSATDKHKLKIYWIDNNCKKISGSNLNSQRLYEYICRFLFSRYSFSDSIEGRTVESCPGVAGTKGYMVSTPVRVGHGIRSVQVYAALSPRATYNSTVHRKENVLCKNLSDAYYLHNRTYLVFVCIVLSVYCDWYLVTNIVYFRIYRFCDIIGSLRLRDLIVHLWVSTGIFSFGR